MGIQAEKPTKAQLEKQEALNTADTANSTDATVTVKRGGNYEGMVKIMHNPDPRKSTGRGTVKVHRYEVKDTDRFYTNETVDELVKRAEAFAKANDADLVFHEMGDQDAGDMVYRILNSKRRHNKGGQDCYLVRVSKAANDAFVAQGGSRLVSID